MKRQCWRFYNYPPTGTVFVIVVHPKFECWLINILSSPLMSFSFYQTHLPNPEASSFIQGMKNMVTEKNICPLFLTRLCWNYHMHFPWSAIFSFPVKLSACLCNHFFFMELEMKSGKFFHKKKKLINFWYEHFSIRKDIKSCTFFCESM